MSEEKQPDMFTTNVAWVHLLRDFMRSGEAARIGGQGILVYLSIKTHVDFNNGKSFPSISTIAREAGISERQVMREIKKLEEKGHLTRKTAQGKPNTYVLQERVGIKSESGSHAVAGFPYVPNQFQRVTEEIKAAVRAGDLTGSSTVKIEVTVNINNTANNNSDGTQLAVFDTSGIAESELKNKYEKLLRTAFDRRIVDDSAS